MKSIYLTQVISNINKDLVELLLMVKDKKIYKNEIIYTLGDITEELTFKDKNNCNNTLNVGDVVKAYIKDNMIVKVDSSEFNYNLNDFMNYVKKDIKSILYE